jgi:hypothetical protein
VPEVLEAGYDQSLFRSPKSAEQRKRGGGLGDLVMWRATIIALAINLLVSPTVTAQVASPTMSVPENVRAILDVPWCRRWRLSCSSCEVRNGGLACERTGGIQENCEEEFKFYYCVHFNPPAQCIVWRDGCNLCSVRRSDGMVSCTLAACKEYHFPNKPTFVCLRVEDR